MPKVGILALQGAVAPHQEKFQSLGIETVLVKKPEHLEKISGIVLPGGESTAMIHLLKLNQLWSPLSEFVRTRPTWGICAGVILLANEVKSPSQESLKAISISVTRNAYGRQNESFIAPLTPTEYWTGPKEVEGVFIRAPKIESLKEGTIILLQHKEEPVLVEQRNILASTFHPELTENSVVHQYFLSKIP